MSQHHITLLAYHLAMVAYMTVCIVLCEVGLDNAKDRCCLKES
jgi:hypothetical protein